VATLVEVMKKEQRILLADESSSATTIGDEPFQYYQKFGKEITVAWERSVLSRFLYIVERPETQVILLDDPTSTGGSSRLSVFYYLIIVNHFYEDFVLPQAV